MSVATQAVIPQEEELLRREQEAQEAVAAVNPATILAFVQIGVSVGSFIAALIGGKKGQALNDFLAVINGFNTGLLTISADAQKMLSQINAVIGAVDQEQLSKLAPVHNQIMAYMNQFPGGVPMVPPMGHNNSYDFADVATHTSSHYFQNIDTSTRGPMAFLPTLCHSTNSRLEFAMSTWPCWYSQSSPAQPSFNQEVNLSTGKLASRISGSRPHIGKEIFIKILKSPPEPHFPPMVEGYQVIDGTKVVWQKMDSTAIGEAVTVRNNLQRQRQDETLRGYIDHLGRWSNATARMAPAAIARALDLGDAPTFLRYVSPETLVLEEPAENARTLGFDESRPVYRALPMRDILLDMLTSEAMRARHGLLVKGADRRAISLWFERTFQRQPSPDELVTLTQVSQMFGSGAFFGCLAYSDEYRNRFGDGLPAGRPVSAPTPAEA